MGNDKELEDEGGKHGAPEGEGGEDGEPEDADGEPRDTKVITAKSESLEICTQSQGAKG